MLTPTKENTRNSLTGGIASSLNLSREEFSTGLRTLATVTSLAAHVLPPLAPMSLALEVASAATEFGL